MVIVKFDYHQPNFAVYSNEVNIKKDRKHRGAPKKNITKTEFHYTVIIPLLKASMNIGCVAITKTRPCNIQRFFTAVKMTISDEFLAHLGR